MALCLSISSISVYFGGELFLSEVTFLVSGIFLVLTKWDSLWRLPGLKICVSAIILGLGAYLMADVFNGSAMLSLIRGGARWAMFAGSALTLGYIIGCYYRGPLFAGVGLIIAGFWNAISVYRIEGWAWKFSLGEPVTLIIVVSSGCLSRWTGAALCLGGGALNFYMDYRSMGGACLICCGFHIFRGGPIAASRILSILMVLGLLVVGIGLYKNAVLEDEARAVRSAESNEIRFAGIELGWRAFKASPLIGHGTWANNPELLAEYTVMLQNSRLLRGARITGGEDANTAIVGAIHSQVLQGAAEAGVLGCIAFLLIAYALFRSFWLAISRANIFLGSEVVCVFYLALSIWAIFASPFSGNNRLLMAMGIASAVRLLVVEKVHHIFYKSPISGAKV
jgi:hypothetical protein